jgi:hypothetical protein
MDDKQDNGNFSPEEAERRFQAALHGALKTPAMPLKSKTKSLEHITDLSQASRHVTDMPLE